MKMIGYFSVTEASIKGINVTGIMSMKGTILMTGQFAEIVIRTQICEAYK